MAYIQLRPKGKEIDRIPSLKLVMEFLDTTGQVKLPVESSVVPLSVEDGTSRPFSNLSVTQVFDQRKLSESKAVVDITVTGEGVLPDLKELFGAAAATLVEGGTWQGFTITKVMDSGSQVNMVEINDSGRLAPAAERTWKLELEAISLGGLPKTFACLTPVIDADSVFQQYRDADIHDAGSEVRLDVAGSTRMSHFLMWFGICVATLIVAFIAWIRMQKNIVLPVENAQVEIPEEINPFSVTRFLEGVQVHIDKESDMMDELTTDLQQVQKQCFAPAETVMSNDALASLCEKWSIRLNG